MTATTLDDFTDDDGGLVFWHPVDDAAIDETYLPAGTVAPGSSADTRVRVRNTSGTYNAVGVVVTIGGPADTTAADGSAQMLLSADGNTFTTACSIGDLAPGQTSAAVMLRRITAPETAHTGFGYTLSTAVGAWTPAASATTATGAGTADPDELDPPLEDPAEHM